MTKSKPVRIRATLPALGTVPIDLHNESATLWEYMGEGEVVPLRTVPHLGVASAVFTGLNHSRLEYALLLCAVISHIAKLHKDEERLGLAGKVVLNGLANKVSSAEELLKCWALLSNYGHTQYTYGAERTILQLARKDKSFQRWLINSNRHADLLSWSRTAIKNYSDEHIHIILLLKRLAMENPYDRRKTAFIHYIRNLVLPIESLFVDDNVQRYKIARLRSLYRSIRLLSMVTIDSYYSGHPFRLHLGAAINGLAGLTEPHLGPDDFEKMVRSTAGWLADELYLHPIATAAQREYEVRAGEQLRDRYAKSGNNRDASAKLLQDIFKGGLGPPQPGRLVPLLRISFSTPRHRLLGKNDLYSTLTELESELCSPPITHLTVDRNRFSNAVHIDLLYRSREAKPADIAHTLLNLRRWLTRTVEAESLSRVRRFYPAAVRRDDMQRTEMLRRRSFQNYLTEDASLLPSLFWAVMRYLLPLGWSARVSDFLPERGRPSGISARVSDSTGHVYDFILPMLDAQIASGEPLIPADRCQELKALRHVVSRSTAPLLLACSEKFVIRDQYGKHRDDWDGVLMEFADTGLFITVVEAKNLKHSWQNENKAFMQLAATRDLVRTRHPLAYRRHRIRNLGAYIRFELG